MSSLTYKKILLKYSGEAVAGTADQGIDPKVLHFMSQEIKSASKKGVSIGVVIGGGNLFRGQELHQDGIDRVAGDHMGMLATVMNGIALRDALERNGVKTRVMSAIPMPGIVEHFDRRLAIQLLEAGFVVIFTAGTGNPFFTTDTTAALRAVEIEAGALLKGTHSGIQGVYDDDPRTNPDAELLTEITYIDVLQKGLKVMDSTAISLCMDNNLPIVVFDLMGDGNVGSILAGEAVGTVVK